MKFLRLSLLVMLLGATSVRADLTIVQNVEGSDGVKTLTMKVKGNKVRVDVSPKITTLLDAKTGEITMLMNDQKQVMRISGERAKQMAEMAKAMMKDTTEGADMTPKATGKTQTINGYETVEYASDAPKAQTSYWIAKSYPGADAIMKQLAVFQNGIFATMQKGLPNFKDLPGLPIRTEVKVDGRLQVTSTIQTVSQDSVPDSEFAIPAGYSEMKMPDIFGGKEAPGQPQE